jgi:hypothetical protein
LEGASEGDVTVEMALVKLIEEDGRDSAQLRILDELAQEDTFGDEANAGPIRGDVFETDLVADLVTEPALALGGDARREETGGETARLEDYDLAVAEQAVLEEDLRDLGGFTGAGRGLDDETGAFSQLHDELLLQLVNREVVAGHRGERSTPNAQRPTLNEGVSNALLVSTSLAVSSRIAQTMRDLTSGLGLHDPRDVFPPGVRSFAVCAAQDDMLVALTADCLRKFNRFGARLEDLFGEGDDEGVGDSD